MSLFQNSVVTKQLESQDKNKLVASWNAFKSHFHNPTIQDNIRNSNEEQYQGEFLIDLFVNVLGYTKNPTPNFNLTTEYKNVKDSKKADGAILVPRLTRGLNPLSLPLVKAVIELKGTNTTDLNKIEIQAFGYKNNQPDCVYVITSNFEKLRFYIDNATEHLEFNLFNLSEKEFELLYLCLAYENIANDVPKKLKEQSLSKESAITKALYTDYSLFKRELHQDLVKQNPSFDALELFQKSQKLLDRFLFLFFAEDRQLLPPNSVRLILNDWRDLQERDEDIPLYNRFKKYFEYLNTGFKGKRYDVFAYNGGLFKPDEILDAVIIDDELLFKHTFKLSEYDFASEVDVNILGHIFENSLNELDEIKAQLEGGIIDKSSSKRKKDGVFYTPKYITKYIVDNTIGKLCIDKKVELNIIEEDYINTKGFKPLAKKTKQPLFEKLTTYRNWLLQITICDPACGSGAFLNQALDFLIQEHRCIDELQAKLFGDAFVLSDVEKSILENNLYGVDLNEESVEIAKLSLWLRTAQPNRKLNDLNNNIKCGNSLIDDVAIAGEKAFNWQTSFPQIFKEKQKKPWHITTAIHDSRTSKRMIDYKVREKRAMGTMPEPQINYLTDNDEMVIVETVAVLVKEQNLNILAFNVCKDHIHIVLVCEENEVDEIVRKIKGRTAREVNLNKGFKPLVQKGGEKSIPLWTQKFGCKEIVDENQLSSTIDYIKANRVKHSLPDNSNKGFKPLVESIVCDYEHAFREEYKGGFDVIIGNPPYVGEKGHSEIFESLKKVPKWNEFYRRRSNTYYFFIKHGIDILKENGFQSLIIPREFTNADWANKVRQDIIENSKIIEIVDFNNLKIFEDAGTTSLILTQKKQKQLEYSFQFKNLNDNNYIQNNLFDELYFSTKSINKLISEDFKPWSFNTFEINYSKNIIPLGNVFDIAQGLVTGADKITKKHIISSLIDEKFIGRGIFILTLGKDLIIDNNNISLKINDDWIVLNELDKSFIKPYFKPEHLQKWYVTSTSTFVLYVGNNDLTENIKKYLLQFDKVLLNRSTINENKIITLNDFESYSIDDIKLNYSSAGAVQKIMRRKKWYLPLYERTNVPFDNSKIVVNTKNMNVFTFSNNPLYSSGGGAGGQNFIYLKDDFKKSILKKGIYTNEQFTMYVNAILNSKLIQFHIQNGQFNQLSTSKIADLPIYISDFETKEVSKNYDEIINYCKLLIEYSIKLNSIIDKFYNYVKSSFPNLDLLKIQNWNELIFVDFILEINKAIKTSTGLTLTKKDEFEWMDLFEDNKAKAQNLKLEIEEKEKEIDAMVYELYGLSKEEIEIVENS